MYGFIFIQKIIIFVTFLLLYCCYQSYWELLNCFYIIFAQNYPMTLFQIVLVISRVLPKQFIPEISSLFIYFSKNEPFICNYEV